MTRTSRTSTASKKNYRTRPNPAQPKLPSGVHDSDFASRKSVSVNPEDQSYTGLGAARLHVEELRSIHDASAMAELRERLNELKIASAWTFERAEILALLNIMADVLDNSMEESAYVQHGAVGLLDRFIEALEDLDRGKVHPALKRAGHTANAALTAQQRRQDQVWLEAVSVLKRARGYPNRGRAERELAGILRKAGKTRMGEPVTAAMLKSLRDHPKKPL